MEALEQRLLLSAEGQVEVEVRQETWFDRFEQTNTFQFSAASRAANLAGPQPSENSVTRPSVNRWMIRLTQQATTALEFPSRGKHTLFGNAAAFHVAGGLGRPGTLLVESYLDPATVDHTLASHPLVEEFELSHAIVGEATPDDPWFPDMGNLAQINAPAAWDEFEQDQQSVGSASIVVGVVDTGIDLAHRDLYLNIWLNPGEIPAVLRGQLVDADGDGQITFWDLNTSSNHTFVTDRNTNGYIDAKDLLSDPIWSNGVDDDANGFTDDLAGWDFHNNDNDPSDDHRHGTHVAGTIGAIGNNSTDVVGINWRVSMIALKVLDEDNRGGEDEAVLAVNYATALRTEHGRNVRLTNNSFTGTEFSPMLQESIAASGEADILFVAAAGNGDIFGDGENIDERPRYPASYDLDNIISVTATGGDGVLASFSNFGACHVLDDAGDIDCSVDIAAPGVGIVSTRPPGTSGLAGELAHIASRNGTSMAAPHVTGVGALLLAREPHASAIEIREAILSGARPVKDLETRVASGGVLDAKAALDALQDTPSARLIRAETISTATEAPVRIFVEYTADVESGGIDLASLDDGDLRVTRANFPNQVLQAQFADACWFVDGTCTASPPVGATHVVRATYLVRPPNRYADLGFAPGWHATDSGEYFVELASSQVRNGKGIGNRGGTLTLDQPFSFEIRIADPNVIFVNTFLDDPLAGITDRLISLRTAILAANGLHDTIVVLPPGDYLLDELGADEDAGMTGDLDIRQSVIILGAGHTLSTIDADEIDRVFHVHPTGMLKLVDVTIQGGRADTGGGIKIEGGHADIRRSVIRDNTSIEAGGGLWNSGELMLLESTVDSNQSIDPVGIGGGGAFNSGSLLINRSTISNNVAAGGFLSDGGGGGLFLGDAASQIVGIVNSTISGNRATSGSGGGVSQASGFVTYVHTTITQNSAHGFGGGIAVASDRAGVSAELNNSIVARNVASQHWDVDGEFLSKGLNLIGIVLDSSLASENPLFGTLASPVDPRLGPLTHNSGPTRTHILLPDSPAIAAPTAPAVGVDQRGIARPRAANQPSTTSLGAVQRHFAELRGHLFHDVDGDGERGINEPPLDGWIVFVDLNHNQALDPGEPNTLTDIDDLSTPQINESEYVLSGLDPAHGAVAVRTVPRLGFVDSTPIVVDALSNSSQSPAPFNNVVLPTERINPVFHLDFSMPAEELVDVSAAGIPIEVGASVSTEQSAGPVLENGRRLHAGRWAGTADSRNQIRIPDHPTLDKVSQTAGSIVTWINVDRETDWNGIVTTACEPDAPQPASCAQFSRTRGIEFQTNPRSGVFGSVQGWNTNNFGPQHGTNGGPGGTETPTGVWTHVALTWNDFGDHTIYVNGVKGRTIKGVGNEPFGLNDPQDWLIGADPVELNQSVWQSDPNARLLQGALADFAIYNAELGGAEINHIIRHGVPRPAEKVFHLDFSVPPDSLADISDQQLPIRVGSWIDTVPAGGPLLQGGLQLSSGLWSDIDDDRNHIDILDHPVLDEVSRSAGAVVTWVKVENERDWNNIFVTQCADGVEPCDAYSPTRGLELQTDWEQHGSVWGSVQGWATQSFGPSHETRAAGRTETASGVWTHVALVWNDRGDHTTYVNGVPGPVVLGVGLEEFGLNETGDWSIGGDRADQLHGLVGDENKRRLHGELADFAIFRGELDREAINRIVQFGVPQPAKPVFHLDFSAPPDELADRSRKGLPIAVGGSIATRAGSGPRLPGGRQLDAGRWTGADDSSNEIKILDHPTLDQVSRSAGSVVTWIKVDNDQEWNGILKSSCAEQRLPCASFSATRGLEFATNPESGVFGTVQGWNTYNFGPAHQANGSGVAETRSGMWTHVALTWNSAGDNTIYVNGVPGPTETGSGVETFALNDPHDWSIGGDALDIGVPPGDRNQRRLRGELADFAIYDVQLQSSDLMHIMSFGVEHSAASLDLPGGVQALAGFGSEPSVVGDRIVFEDHLGRVQVAEGPGHLAPLVGLNSVSVNGQPFADGQSISFDGESVAFTGRLQGLAGGEPNATHPSSIFLVNQFGAFQELVNQDSIAPNDASFTNKTFEVHSVSDALVAFGVREPDRIDHVTGHVVENGENRSGLYVASISGGMRVLADTNTRVPDTNQKFRSFAAARLDEFTFAIEGTFEGGFGIYEKRGVGALQTVVDHTTPISGGQLSAIKSFAFSSGEVLFHGIGNDQQGVYLARDGGISVVADRSTNIPGDMGTFQSFGEVALDKGNAVFIGRGRPSWESKKAGLHEQVGIYASLGGILQRVVDLQPEGQPSVFEGRLPVELSIGPEAISGNRVVFYAAFSDGTDGIFTVEFESQSKHDVVLKPGVVVQGLDFGRKPLPGEIRGESYHDINRNGRRDPDEPGLPGWTIFLDEDNDGIQDLGEAATTTGESGAYGFVDLPALRHYTVRQVPQENWVASSVVGSSHEFFLQAKESMTGVDFANRSTVQIDGQGSSGKIRVVVFNDLNANGKFDSDESRLTQNEVYIDVNNNGLFEPDIDALPKIVDGNFEFTDLAMTAHEVRLRRATNFQQTTPLGNSFDIATMDDVGDRPTALVSGLFDADLVVDLIVANNTSNTLSFLPNASRVSGGITSAIDHQGNGPIAIVVDDFGGDHVLDLAVASFHSSDVSVLHGRGDGTFNPPFRFVMGEQAGPVSISRANLNGDSRTDLVISNSLSDRLTLLTNSGAGGFQQTDVPIDIGDKPQGVVAGKFTPDDLDDIVVVAQKDAAVRVLLNLGNNQFVVRDPIRVGSRPSAIVADDFDGDEHLDVAVANIGSASISVLFGNGLGAFPRTQTIHVGTSPIALTSADIDADNDIDIVFTRSGELPISLLRNDGSGNFQAAGLGGAADFLDNTALPFSIVAADVNGDDVIDLVVAHRDSDNLTVFENRIVAGSHRVTLETNAPEQEVMFGVVLDVDSALPGDVNLDGVVSFSDFIVLAANYGRKEITWSEGDFDNDQRVGFSDFLILVENFGRRA